MDQYIKLEGKKGFTTFKFGGKYIYSAYNPVNEARRYVGSLGTVKPVVITCCGLDYVNDELAKLDNVKLIISFEPVDFGNAAGKKKIIRVKTAGRIEEILLSRDIHAGQITLVLWKDLLETDPSLFLEPLRRIMDAIHKSSLSSNTAKAFGFIESKNVLLNLITLEDFPCLVTPAAKPHSPAVIISPGASLYDNAGFIDRVKNNAVLFALPSSLPFLQANGISPDYAIAVDPGYATYYHLAKYKKTIRLILPLTSNINVFRPGNYEHLLFSYDNYFENIFYENTGIMVSPPEGTVFINLLRIIRKMGFDDAVLVGQDFGFKNGISHVKGGFFENELLHDAGYFCSLDHKMKSHESLMEKTVIETCGMSIPTNAALKAYYEHFVQKDFGLNLYLPKKCYNPLSDKIEKIDEGFILDNFKNKKDTSPAGLIRHIGDAAQRNKNVFCELERIYDAITGGKSGEIMEPALEKSYIERDNARHLKALEKIINSVRKTGE